MEQYEFIDVKETHFQLVKEKLMSLFVKEQIHITLLSDNEDVFVKPGDNLVILGKGMCVNTHATAKD